MRQPMAGTRLGTKDQLLHESAADFGFFSFLLQSSSADDPGKQGFSRIDCCISIQALSWAIACLLA